MKNNTDELIELELELELEIREFIPESESEFFFEQAQQKWFEKDSVANFLKILESDKTENEYKKKTFPNENKSENPESEDEENSVYYPLDENHSETKLLYMLSFGSLFFLGVLINSIFG